MSKNKSLYADANILILKTIGKVLEEYIKEDAKGNFQYKHEEIKDVKGLWSEYRNLERNNFKEIFKCQDWMCKVADILPSLYD